MGLDLVRDNVVPTIASRPWANRPSSVQTQRRGLDRRRATLQAPLRR